MYWFTKEQFHTYEETEKGVFGLFDTPKELLEAAEKTKQKNYQGFDCFTPYPVHGLDDAMGLPRSGIPWVSFFMGLFGCVMGFLFPYLVHAHDWQINFSGKALNAWPAYVPVIFEMTVFMAGMSGAFTLFYLLRVKGSRRPLHPDVTSHRFALWIPASAPNYKEEEVVAHLKSLGAKDITVLK